MRPCALYARFSSDKQNPMSCQDQLREARQFAAAQGWEVVGEWHDDGVSGTKGRSDRFAWDEMLGFIEAGGLHGQGVVLTWDIDRWSRDWADGMIEALRLHKLGVDLADTKDGLLEQHGLAGKILLTLKVAGADEFIQKLRRNVKRGLDAKRKAGYYTCPPPFGYDNERREGGSVLIPNPVEAPVVRSIFQLLDEGKTPAAIARQLNTEKIRSKRGGPWNPASIRELVRSPVYIGKLARYDTRGGRKQVSRRMIPEHKIQILEGKHDGLVSEEVWHRVKSRMSGKRRRGPNSKRDFPLQGLVKCGECSTNCMVTGGKWPYRNYRCRPYGLTSECTSNRIVRVEHLEEAVRAWAAQAADDGPGIAEAAVQIATQERQEALEVAQARGPLDQELRELQHQQERLLDALYQGNAPALINQRLNQVQERMEEVEAQLEALGRQTHTIPAEEIEMQIRASLRDGALDLGQLGGIISQITLPADWDEPISLEAFGQVFPLNIPAPLRRPK